MGNGNWETLETRPQRIDKRDRVWRLVRQVSGNGECVMTIGRPIRQVERGIRGEEL